jgi:hypothetical protein
MANYKQATEKITSDKPKTYIRLHVKYPLFLSDFNEKRSCSIDFQNNSQISNFVKSRLVVENVPCRWTDGGRTNMQNLVVAFRKIAKSA